MNCNPYYNSQVTKTSLYILNDKNIVHSKQVTEEMHSQSRKLLKLGDNNFKNYYSSYTQ